MTTHAGVAMFPLLMMLFLVIGGLIVLFVKLGGRGRVIMGVCLVGLIGLPMAGVVVGISKSAVVNLSSRNNSQAINTYPVRDYRYAEPEPMERARSARAQAEEAMLQARAAVEDAHRQNMDLSERARSQAQDQETLDKRHQVWAKVLDKQQRVWAEAMSDAGNIPPPAVSPPDPFRASADTPFGQVLDQQHQAWAQVFDKQERVSAEAMLPPDLSSPEPWKSPADLEFAADLHPSAAAAAESLVVEILKMKDAAHPDLAIKRVQIWAGEGLDADVVSRTLNRLHRRAPDWTVMVEALEPGRPIEESDEQAASLRLEVPKRSTTHRAAWDSTRPENGGVLRMRLTFKGGSIERSTNFADKPWVENTSEFISAKPQMKWVVGYSSQTATDRAEARQQALRSAAAHILPEVRTRLQSRTSFDDRWLLSAIERELSGASEVRDRFVQTLIVKSGGQIVREAVLVQSPAVVNRVEAASLSYQRQQYYQAQVASKSWVALIASAAGMVVLICVVGVLLNTITKGYYRGHLVLAVGLVLMLGVLVLV